jgi:hypothetical protein
VFPATPEVSLNLILIPSGSGGSVALGKPGAQLSDNRQGTDLVVAKHLDEVLNRSSAATQSDPTDQLCRALFARITETVISHETDDWSAYYDELGALVCRVIAQSSLSAEAKAVLTRRLIEHVLELEKWWPRLKPE